MALVEAWKGDDAGLGRMLLPETRVETPIWSCASARDYLDELAGACRFFTNAGRTPPALAVLSTGVVRPGVAKVQWSLGVEWPSAWRSRVNLLAESELLLESGGGGGGGPRVRAIKETWHEAPLDVFGRQVTPRLRDLVSLWNSPTAEHVRRDRAEIECRGLAELSCPPHRTAQWWDAAWPADARGATLPSLLLLLCGRAGADVDGADDGRLPRAPRPSDGRRAGGVGGDADAASRRAGARLPAACQSHSHHRRLVIVSRSFAAAARRRSRPSLPSRAKSSGRSGARPPPSPAGEVSSRVLARRARRPLGRGRRR